MRKMRRRMRWASGVEHVVEGVDHSGHDETGLVIREKSVPCRLAHLAALEKG